MVSFTVSDLLSNLQYRRLHSKQNLLTLLIRPKKPGSDETQVYIKLIHFSNFGGIPCSSSIWVCDAGQAGGFDIIVDPARRLSTVQDEEFV